MEHGSLAKLLRDPESQISSELVISIALDVAQVENLLTFTTSRVTVLI